MDQEMFRTTRFPWATRMAVVMTVLGALSAADPGNCAPAISRGDTFKTAQAAAEPTEAQILIDACGGGDDVPPDKMIAACTARIEADARKPKHQLTRDDAFPYSNRGEAYAKKGEHKLASADFTRAVEIDPTFAWAFNGRAQASAAIGDQERAIADYTRVIQIEGDIYDIYEVNPYAARGDAYLTKGDKARAGADYDKAIALYAASPHYGAAPAYSGRGRIRILDNKCDAAIADFTKALEIDENLIQALVFRASCYGSLGQHDKAVADYSKAITLDPDYASAYSSRAASYFQLGERDKARADLEAVLRFPDDQRLPFSRRSQAREGLAKLDAADQQQAQQTAAPKLRRVALVIGNAAYTVHPLINAGNDAAAIAKSLKDELGFDLVMLRPDLNRRDMVEALKTFQDEAARSDIAVVFFSGHGTERPGRENYLIPVDAKLAREDDLEDEAISLGSVQNRIKAARLLSLVMLDACRTNDFPLAGRNKGGARGLGRAKPEGNMLIAYATSEDQVADDGDGRHSPFTTALLRHMATPGLDVRRLLGKVRDDVKRATRDVQVPTIYGTLGGDEIFLRPGK